MATLLVLLTEDDATVYRTVRRGAPEMLARFEAHEAGRERLSRWLRTRSEREFSLVLDCGGEEFQAEILPRLGRRDRRAYIRHRRARTADSSAYRALLSQYLGSGRGRRERLLQCSAGVSTAIDTWLDLLEHDGRALRGILSVALLSESLLRTACPPGTRCVAFAVGRAGLRQTLLDEYGLVLSRLLPLAAPAAPEPERIRLESARARAFMEQAGGESAPPAVLLIDHVVRPQASSEAGAGSGSDLVVLSPAAMLRRSGIDPGPEPITLESMYVWIASRQPSANHYASPGRLWRLHARRRCRLLLLGCGLAVAATTCFTHALNARADILQNGARRLQAAAGRIDALAGERRRRLDAYPVSPEGARQAVGIYRRHILAWPSPDDSLIDLSSVLGRHPTLRLRRLDWSFDPGAGPGIAGLASEAPPATDGRDVPEGEGRRRSTGLRIVLSGEVQGPDGAAPGYRQALSLLERFRADVSASGPYELVWKRLPIQLGPDAVTEAGTGAAVFEAGIELRREPASAAIGQGVASRIQRDTAP